jgi:hypothetical protein
MTEERFLSKRGPLTAIQRWSDRPGQHVYALRPFEGRQVVADLRRSGRTDILCRLHALAVGFTRVGPPTPSDVDRMQAAIQDAIERERLLFIEGWSTGARGGTAGHQQETAIGKAVSAITDARGQILFEGRRYVLVERSPSRQPVFRGDFQALDPDAARDLLTRMAAEQPKGEEKSHWAVLLGAPGRNDRVPLPVEILASRQSSGAGKALDAPAPTSAPPPRRAEPKVEPKKGTLALVFDILAEEDHDKPVLFVLESNDGSVKDTLFVTDDKVVAHDRIELRWHDLPEDLRYSLHLKQADGDIEMLFSNVPFAELSGHTDDREAAEPHAPIEDQE